MEIKKDFAILLGNGINNNAFYKLGNADSNSWKALLKKMSQKKFDEQILEPNTGVTYPEVFDLISRNGKNFKELKQDLTMNLENWSNTEIHNKFIRFAQENNIPVLTTNYDTCLLDEDFVRKVRKVMREGRAQRKKYAPIYQKKHGKGFSDIYPWFSCYSDKEVIDPLNEFAIWHIHGFRYYKRSLVIGSVDYTSTIKRLKEFLYNKSDGLFKNETNWRGKNSWLDIFFNKKLYIIGLGLDSQEIDLRWLFMEREKYLREVKGLNLEELKSYTNYIYTDKKNDLPLGKEYFFYSLNINTIKKSYDEIYSDWLLTE